MRRIQGTVYRADLRRRHARADAIAREMLAGRGGGCRMISRIKPYRSEALVDPETTKLTIRLPKRHVAFAKAYAKAHGLSVTEVIDRYLRRMRALDQYSPGPELEAITGLIPGDVDVEDEYRRHVQDKHSR